jgi:GTPase
MVFNKVDLVDNAEMIETYARRFPGCVAISARTGAGVAGLVQALEDELGAWRLRSRFRVPLTEAGLIAEIHRIGHVLELRYEDEFALIVAHLPPQMHQRLAAFAV